MRVGIDVTGLHWKYRTGVQNLFYGLIEGLADLGAEGNDPECVLVDRSGAGGRGQSLHLPESLAARQPAALEFLPTFQNSPAPVKPAAALWNRAVARSRREIVNRREALDRVLGDLDVFHVWAWDVCTAPRARHVITLTDVIPILYANLFSDEFVKRTQFGLEFARWHADRVVAISNFTKEELVRVAGVEREKIAVIYPGVRSIFTTVDTHVVRQVRRRYGIEHVPYVLSVGFLDPRKNVIAHLRAFERLVADKAFSKLQLVLAGPESHATPGVAAELASTPVRDRVHVTGFVSDADLIALLNGASAFLYCSAYEGFGFPVLEAMACGAPVVTSNTTSLAEISGDAALLVDPADFDQIAGAVRRLLTDSALADSLKTRGYVRAAQFSWAKCAREHIRLYRDCSSRGS